MNSIKISPKFNSGINSKVGLIALSTDFMIEKDFKKIIENMKIDLFVNRIRSYHPLTKENLIKMSENVTEVSKDILPDEKLDCVVYGCTSGTIASGYDSIKNKINLAKPGARVVTPSSAAVNALRKMKVSKISLTNRTKEKAESLKNFFKDLEIVEWGERIDFDMIINATSIGLKKEDGLNFDYSANGPDKYFYDVIYNPKETLFLKRAKLFGNKTENGKMMFIYQAHQSFTIWNKVMPKIDDETIKLI